MLSKTTPYKIYLMNIEFVMSGITSSQTGMQFTNGCFNWKDGTHVNLRFVLLFPFSVET